MENNPFKKIILGAATVAATLGSPEAKAASPEPVKIEAPVPVSEKTEWAYRAVQQAANFAARLDMSDSMAIGEAVSEFENTAVAAFGWGLDTKAPHFQKYGVDDYTLEEYENIYAELRSLQPLLDDMYKKTGVMLPQYAELETVLSKKIMKLKLEKESSPAVTSSPKS